MSRVEAASLRLEARGQVERCPYCHDLAGEADALLTCAGCGTSHHAECVAELGRCTVLGCERPLVHDAAAPRAPAARRAQDELRRRVRARVHALRSSRTIIGHGEERAALAEALREVDACAGRRLWADLSDALARVHELQMRLGGGEDRRDIPGWINLARLRERLEEADRRAGARDLGHDVRRMLLVAVALAVAGVTVLVVVRALAHAGGT